MKIIFGILAITLSSCGVLTNIRHGVKQEPNPSDDQGANSTGKGAPSCTLVANPATVAAGSSTTLTLHVKGETTSANLNGKVTATVEGAKLKVSPMATSSYGATVTGPDGSGACTAEVKVTGAVAGAASCSISLEPESIAPGGSVIATMTTSGTVASATLDGHPVTLPSSIQTLTPDATTAISGLVVGAKGETSSCSTVVTVSLTPPSPSSAPTATPKATPAPSADLCRADTSAIDHEVTAVETANTASYNQALTTSHLSVLHTGVTITLSGNFNGITPDDYCQVDTTWDNNVPCPATIPAHSSTQAFTEGTVYTFINGTKTQAFLAGGLRYTCGDAGDAFPVVEDAEDNVYKLNAKPNVLSTKVYKICGCGSGACPNASELQDLFLLPSADAYKGSFDLPYDVNDINLEFDGLEHARPEDVPSGQCPAAI